MKPFLSIDVTENKKNETKNGMHFMVQKPSPELADTLKNLDDKFRANLQKARLPLFWRIVQWITAILGASFAVGLLKSMTGADAVTITEAFSAVPELFVIGLSCLAVALILYLKEKRMGVTLSLSDENTRIINGITKTTDLIYEELGLPENARKVDLLTFRYKVKNSKMRFVTKGLQTYTVTNDAFLIFADPKYFYLTTYRGKFAFSRADVRAIRTVNKQISMKRWNKDCAINDDRYKKYKLTTDKYNNIYCKPYYVLELDIEGETWGIFFPNYELPLFEALTGLKAEYL